MLILSRKMGEKIAIDGGRIVVTVIDLSGVRVRLGIEAPAEMGVHRAEIQSRIDAGMSTRPNGQPVSESPCPPNCDPNS